MARLKARPGYEAGDAYDRGQKHLNAEPKRKARRAQRRACNRPSPAGRLRSRRRAAALRDEGV